MVPLPVNFFRHQLMHFFLRSHLGGVASVKSQLTLWKFKNKEKQDGEKKTCCLVPCILLTSSIILNRLLCISVILSHVEIDFIYPLFARIDQDDILKRSGKVFLKWETQTFCSRIAITNLGAFSAAFSCRNVYHCFHY